MILSFADKEAEHFFKEGSTKASWQTVSGIVSRKLDALNAAHRLSDLRAPPGNQLESLKGDRAGQHSIRINKSMADFLSLDRCRSARR
jgi:toxin HigB-1